jgi:hypothetical protein
VLVSVHLFLAFLIPADFNREPNAAILMLPKIKLRFLNFNAEVRLSNEEFSHQLLA